MWRRHRRRRNNLCFNMPTTCMIKGSLRPAGIELRPLCLPSTSRLQVLLPTRNQHTRGLFERKLLRQPAKPWTAARGSFRPSSPKLPSAHAASPGLGFREHGPIGIKLLSAREFRLVDPLTARSPPLQAETFSSRGVRTVKSAAGAPRFNPLVLVGPGA